MGVSVYPATVSSAGPDANSITCASANTLYGAALSLSPAIYTISCATTTVAKVEFLSNISTVITTGTTVSGTITVNLATQCDRVRVWTDTGSNIVVTITLTASAINNDISGTLQTITSSQTYTGTSTSGYAYAMLVGGGKGGSSGNASGADEGTNGYAGQVVGGIVALTGSMPIVIGTGGAGGAATPGYSYGTINPGTNGTATTFAGLTANGGGTNTAATPTSIYGFMAYPTTSPYGVGGSRGNPGGGGNGVGGGAGAAGTSGAVYILRY